MTVIIMVAAAAGIYFYMNRFDPVRYVQAVLDVSYKEKTEEYSKMTGTSRKEAEAVFEKNLDVTMEKFHSSAISEELEKKYRILFTQIVRQVNYQIGESEKQKDGSYIVELEIRPVTLFSDTYETFQSRAEEYAQSITNKVMKGMEIPSEEEMQGQVYQIYYDVLNEALQEGIRSMFPGFPPVARSQTPNSARIMQNTVRLSGAVLVVEHLNAIQPANAQPRSEERRVGKECRL